jgi:hypothetical protein
MNILTYTDNEIIKNLALVENHFKQAPSGDEVFCSDCINKHLILLEGLSEEGMAVGDPEKYKKVYNFSKKTKNKDYKSKGIELANEARQIRKSFSDCKNCEEKLGPEKVETIKYLTKSLNTGDDYNNYKLNLSKNKMADFKELGMINAGQFAAEGIRYVVETYKPEWDKYVSIGGGIGLQALPLVWKGCPEYLAKIFNITGSNLLANGTVKLIKGAITPTATARAVSVNSNSGVGGYAGKSFSYAPSFGGPTFGGRVTAQNIPTRYARAGILAGAQAFESPEHADLIRVD